MKRAVLVAVALLSGCGKSDAPKAAPVIMPSIVASAAPPVPVDLLWTVPSIVAVSSRVDNPRDLPDFIVDHKADTAWNGRTGDLVGGYVAFRVPKDSHVAWIDLVVGYDRKTDTEDLFTANMRIKTVKIFRDKTIVKTATLDSGKREPQRIPIDLPGGDYKLEVTEVASGTNARWKELVVSELAVFGTPGAKRNSKAGPPFVRVGGLNALTPTVEVPAREPSALAACATVVQNHQIAFNTLLSTHPPSWTGEGEPLASFSCRPGAVLPSAASAFLGSLELTEHSEDPFYYAVRFEGAMLGIKTSGGVFATDVRIGGRETAMYWTLDYALLSVENVTSQGRDALVIQVVERRVTDSDGMGTPEELHSENVSHDGTICELDAHSKITCRTTSTDLTVANKDVVKSSPVRTTPSGEIVIDVANARR